MTASFAAKVLQPRITTFGNFQNSVTVPEILTSSAAITATARNGAPLNFWQSLQ
jgi:hypothetical protein